MADTQLDVEVPIPGSADSIQAACHTLTWHDQTTFDVLVDRFEKDDITAGIANRTYRFPIGFALLPLLARPGQRVLDLGAHIGTFSLLAAKLGYHVAAVEASPRNAALLQASAKQNHLDTLQVVNTAVSDRTETLEFVQAGPYGVVATPHLDAPTITVQAQPVATILASLAWDKVDFIKLDVEGSEIKALAGMRDLLARPDAPPILYESNGITLHYFDHTPNELLQRLEELGYHCYLVEPGQLIPLRADALQFRCTVDCLATKTPPDHLPGMQRRAPLTREEQIEHIVSGARETHPHLRLYLARTLRNADADLLSDPRVIQAIGMLLGDPDPAVRQAMAWYLSQENLLAMFNVLNASLCAQEQELKRLRMRVREFEQGRFIRFMEMLHRWSGKLTRR